MAEVVLDKAWAYPFPINDALQAYIWSHQTDPKVTQLDHQARQVSFERVEELPVVIQAAFGKAITMREEATMTDMGFNTKINGDLPGAEFAAQMTFAGAARQETTANVAVTITWKSGVADFVKQAIRAFITTRVSSWCDSLGTHLDSYKRSTSK